MDKIIFKVIEHNGKKYFEIVGQETTLLFTRILAEDFLGDYKTRCEVVRDSIVHDSAVIEIIGTHAASEAFCGFTKILEPKMRNGYTDAIFANMLELGDNLEVENIRAGEFMHYKNNDKFIVKFITINSMSKDFSEIFNNKDKSISSIHAMEILYNKKQESVKEVAANKLIVID